MADQTPENFGSAITVALTTTLVGQLTSGGTVGRFLASALLKLQPESFTIPVSDEATPLSAGAAKVTFRMPYAFTLTGVRGSVTTAPTGGTLLTVNVKKNGTTIFSTNLTFNAGSKTTVGASTPAVLSVTSIADDDEMTIDIVAVGSTISGAGLKITFLGRQT